MKKLLNIYVNSASICDIELGTPRKLMMTSPKCYVSNIYPILIDLENPGVLVPLHVDNVVCREDESRSMYFMSRFLLIIKAIHVWFQ